jgi:hypothetical protein
LVGGEVSMRVREMWVVRSSVCWERVGKRERGLG